MNNLLTLSILSMFLIGCSKDLDKPKADQSIGLNEPPNKIEDPNYTDDFRKNIDTNNKPQKSKLTSDLEDHQEENEADKTITINSHHILIKDDQLSAKGKNIRIITNSGVVTLRGIVETNAEKTHIENEIKNINGVQKVDNQLDVQDIEIGN